MNGFGTQSLFTLENLGIFCGAPALTCSISGPPEEYTLIYLVFLGDCFTSCFSVQRLAFFNSGYMLM